ncbi:hypothetical protein QR680_005995 [Steinernema hermaphroditum]|uniref:Lipase n=1 Tax=Steinernema hermaphroditum TaxID=289476 RepID=A0AA39HV24_9BILA|nr:hypothetical protein QR680_005995 [Steinernema hermaphroditum]
MGVPTTSMVLCIWFRLALSLDPEVEMNTITMIQHWGYQAEAVEVTTEDGYILQLHHIVSAPNQTGEDKIRPVVFLQHGLLAASDVWVSNLPNESAGFMFADAGFDVWLGNSRGNTYGKRNVNLSTATEEFWEFSWDEMAKYDLPASIEVVLQRTAQSFLYYVAHSQGTTMLFARNSVDGTLKAKVRKHFALGPVATFKYIQGLFALMAEYIYPLWQKEISRFGSSEFFPSNWLTRDLLAEGICSLPILGDVVCAEFLFSIAGPDTHQLNESRIPVYIAHLPAGTSSQNMLHWFQMTHSGKTQAYNYGNPRINEKHYGSVFPPLYNISKVNIDTYLFWGDDDYLADPRDVQQGLLPFLNPQILKGNTQLANFNHMDFIWGLRAPEEVYRSIIGTIKADWNSL